MRISKSAKRRTRPSPSMHSTNRILRAVDRRTQNKHLSTKLTELIRETKSEILDGSATVPDLLEALDTAERWADALDHRRTALDPSLGGKVK